jgi:hypothetical protein
MLVGEWWVNLRAIVQLISTHVFEISSLLFEFILNFAVIRFKYVDVQSKWND